MPRQKTLEERYRPGFQGFRQQRVVGVAADSTRHLPGTAPTDVVLIDEQAHELDDRERRMRIVQLDGNGTIELADAASVGQMLRDHVLERCAHAEILLPEPQLLALRRRIVRIQHAREILRIHLFGDRGRIVARVEIFDAKRRDGPPRPQPQMIHRGAAIAGNQQVISDGPDIVGIDPFVEDTALLVAHRPDVATEAHAITDATAAAFPEIVHAEPGARDFALRAVAADDLHENAVVVANTVARRGIAERRERIQKARCEATQTAVAESRILFFRRDVFEVVSERRKRLAHLIDQAIVERRQRIDQAASEQKLHRQITDTFDMRLRNAGARRNPPLRELLAHGNRQRIVEIATCSRSNRLAERALEPIDDGIANRAGTKSDGGGERRHF